MRRMLIAGNWKMYKTTAEAAALVEEMKKGAAGAPSDVLVAPPYTSLVAVVAAAKGSAVPVASHARDPRHSERRQYFAETDEGVAKKTKVALESGLTPVSCVGETLAEREAARTIEVVGRQTDAILSAVSADLLRQAVAASPTGVKRSASP